MEINGWTLTFPQHIGKIFTSGNEVAYIIENRIVIRLNIFGDRVIVVCALEKVDVDSANKLIELL